MDDGVDDDELSHEEFEDYIAFLKATNSPDLFVNRNIIEAPAARLRIAKWKCNRCEVYKKGVCRKGHDCKN